MGKRRARTKLLSLAALCIAVLLVLLPTFGATAGGNLSPSTQFALIAFGGFLMTCSVGPVSAVVIDVVHPGVRATGASVLSLFQNLLGLAAGPFIAGALSDVYGLETALTLTPLFGLAAAAFFLLAARSYEADIKRVADVHVEVETGQPVAMGRKAMA